MSERKIGLRNIVVNSLGEVINTKPRTQSVICGSINVDVLTEQLGRKPTDKDLKKAFEQEIRDRLMPADADKVIAVWKLQEKNDSRFRVWMRKGHVYLSTEFNALLEQEDVWTKIKTAAKTLGVKTWVMHEMPHLDRTSRDGGTTWIEGPNHGKMERQVSLDVELSDLTLSELRRVTRRVAKVTEEAWQASGIAII